MQSVRELVGKDDLRNYRGAGVQRMLVTAIECVSADGRRLDPLVVWPAANISKDVDGSCYAWLAACLANVGRRARMLLSEHLQQRPRALPSECGLPRGWF